MNKLAWVGITTIMASILVFIVSPLFGSINAQDVFAATQAAGKIRFVPITVGDMMISQTNVVSSGDCCNGILFKYGTQSGGSITFPLPEDYIVDTQPGMLIFLFGG